jgi:hypothetical protein
MVHERCLWRRQAARHEFWQVDDDQWCAGPNEGKCLDLKVRALYVDG